MTRNLLVTGASRGIGRDVALKAAERGYAVGVNYTSNKAKADEVVAAIRDGGGKAVAIQADVSDAGQVERLFKTFDAELGTLHALVNNAGVGATQGPLETTKPEDLVRTFEVNVFGLFYCSQQAVRRMSTDHGGKGGAIVNVSSAAARSGGVNAFIDYAASKAAVDRITCSLAMEVGGQGIRVNAVRPGVTETDMIEEIRDVDPGWLDQVVKNMPMGRLGQVHEISAPILWLLSDEAAYVTGTIIDASGGRATP
jgi:NAD(P)-dependent dehydrogenase (short-subunit alcohol dehydrogenase family)